MFGHIENVLEFVDYYNLDVIILVGYCVKSKKKR